jgi:rubrerythrin
MSPEEIRSIIGFAIDKEQEAIEFYTDLAGRVKSEAIAEELLNLAQMERGHKAKLQNLDVDVFVASTPAPVKDLKIANYTVNAIPHQEMTWPDIINIAMHRELAAVNLYRDLASQVDDPTVKQLFENLAAEEQKHKLYLETIWDQDVMKEN